MYIAANVRLFRAGGSVCATMTPPGTKAFPYPTVKRFRKEAQGSAGGVRDVDDSEIEGSGATGLYEVVTVRNLQREPGIFERGRESGEVLFAGADNRGVEFNRDNLLDLLVSKQFPSGPAVAAPDDQGPA